MKHIKFASLCLVVLAFATSCKKSGSTISQAQIVVGKPISNAAPLPTGSYKGTMLANQTFIVNGDLTVNAGDTLLIQKGVTIQMNNAANFIVKGTLVSLGTKDAPVTITDPRRIKQVAPSTVATDSAFKGGWGGIYCDKTCPLLVIKWTHLDFGGSGLKTPPFTGPSTGDQYIIYWQNPNGNFILEDSWMYGSPDDAIRFYGGHINMMRNTLEKCGSLGGDGMNAKGGTQGNMAYNLIIGGATNGTKSANDGAVPGGPQCQIAMYNNTYVNNGFRNKGVYGARSGSVEVENNSRALAYNNLIVNCDFGVRIAGGNNVTAKVYLADTLQHSDGPIMKTAYGYNFYYADSTLIANQFVPTNIAQAVVTHPQATDIPNMAAFLGAGYTAGKTYDGSSLVGKNNPQFVNYPLPNTKFRTQASVDGYDFHLQGSSPAAGKGFQGFSAITNVPVDPNFGSSGITGPGKDIGAYQLDGSGNQH